MMLYPVNLNIEEKLCLIVGGGEVASRKVGSLLQCGAKVQVISPQVSEKIRNLAGEGVLDWLARGYHEGDLDGFFMVFAATDDRILQEKISHEAKEKNVLFNSANDPESCSFQLPATVRSGDFLVAVSTGGGSPAFSAQIRKKIEEEYGAEYGVFVSLLAKVRELVVSDGESQESHKILFEKLLQSNILASIREKNLGAVAGELDGLLPGHIDVKKIMSVVGSET